MVSKVQNNLGAGVFTIHSTPFGLRGSNYDQLQDENI